MPNPSPRWVSGTFHLFDTVLLAFTSAAATVIGFVAGQGAPLGADAAAAAVLVGLLVAGLGLALGGLRNRGVMLTLSLRVLCLIVISVGATTAITVASQKTVPGPLKVTDWRAQYDTLQATSAAQLKAAKFEIELVRVELARERELRSADATRRAELDAAVDQKTAAFEAARLAARDSAVLPKLPSPEPVVPDTAKPTASRGDADEPALLKAVEISPEHADRLRRTVEGRNVLDHIFSGIPLFGPAIGSLLGGGRTIREEMVVILGTLQEGKRIPSEEELYSIFGAAPDPAKLADELKVVARRAADRGIVSREQVTIIEERLDTIAAAVRLPLEPNIRSAADKLAGDIGRTGICNPDITLPAFTGFPSRRSKLRTLAMIRDPVLRDCLRRYPPTDS